MPRALWELAVQISNTKSDTLNIRDELRDFKNHEEGDMIEICKTKFMGNFTKAESKSTAVLSILRILRGSMVFEPSVKELYDAGICFYDKTTKQVLPVNRCAELALYKVFSDYAHEALPSVSAANLSQSYKGTIFEANLIATIAPKHGQIFVKVEPLKVKGHNEEPKIVNFCAAQVKVFGIIDSKTPPKNIDFDPDDFVLWLCQSFSDSFTCDGIIVPHAGDLTSPIIIVEASVTNMYDRTAAKYKGLRELRKQLMALPCFTRREVIVVLCWHEELTNKQVKKGKKEDPEMYKGFYTLDRKQLEKLGVPL
jgi:hypothetical protein